MKRNAFTLIELLAVIVILAIIALIAVPIVLGIINDSKKSSEKESLNLYTDTVEKTIAKKQMNNPNFNPNRCEIQTSGNLECFNGTTSLGIVEISMKGKLPTSGTILIKEGKPSFINILLDSKKYYEVISLISDVDNNKEISVGDKYAYKVNDSDTFNFYVLSIEDDKVNLMMDKNICEDGTTNYTQGNNYCKYAWYSASDNNNYGPVTAMTVLYNATKNWINVPDMNLSNENSYVDENNSNNSRGYVGMTTNNGVLTIIGKNAVGNATIGNSNNPLKARLPKYIEVTGTGCSGTSHSCPDWIIDNYDYWLLVTMNGFPNRALNVSTSLYIANDIVNFNSGGIRPVITVLKKDLLT